LNYEIKEAKYRRAERRRKASERMNLEMAAMRWLWLEKGCHIVLEQRSPRYMIGSPDVLGITSGRYMTEIEIKRSASDFAADAKKYSKMNRKFYIQNHPRQFYYLMPEALALKLRDRVPDWAGLMACPFYPQIQILKVAPVNEASQKLTAKECVKLARAMTNHMMAYAVNNYANHRNFVERDSQFHIEWTDVAKGTYEI